MFLSLNSWAFCLSQSLLFIVFLLSWDFLPTARAISHFIRSFFQKSLVGMQVCPFCCVDLKISANSFLFSNNFLFRDGLWSFSFEDSYFFIWQLQSQSSPPSFSIYDSLMEGELFLNDLTSGPVRTMPTSSFKEIW